MRYSPKPKSEYVQETGEGSLRGFGASDLLDYPGVWNLFFLSEPNADISERWEHAETLPEYTDLIWPCYDVTCEVFPNLVEAINTLPPAEFIAAIKTMNYHQMPTYEMLGVQWFEIMERRATPRGVEKQVDNILFVNFMGNS